MPSHRLLRPSRWWLVVLCSLCSLSCSGGGALTSVQGKVLYKGQPLSGALVTFHPKEGADMNVTLPTGFTKEDGTFTLTTGQKEGAAPGEYVVTVICSEVPKTAKKVFSTGGPETQDRLGGAYAHREKSRITATIKKGVNNLDPFDLK